MPESGQPLESSLNEDIWPDLPLNAWEDTYITLHLWTQIIGKVRMKLSPMANHWWQVPLYVTPRGLGTTAIPHGVHLFDMEFDFIDHELRIRIDTGEMRSIPLRPFSIADFYREAMSALHSLGIYADIWTTPVEVPYRIPFDRDVTHTSYDREYAHRFWKILVQADRIMKKFRCGFRGKASPVHFFWGAFDLAVTRFSGRPAPEHPGGPNVGRFVMLEAYSHEVSSCGFWPGAGLGMPAFYSYSYPEPPGYRNYAVQPEAAYYHKDIGEFILPYEAVRTADDPERQVDAFLQSTYEAAAVTGGWDRPALER